MTLKEWFAFFLCIMLVISVWCLYVVALQEKPHKQMTQIHPLDLTVTYCDACQKCTSPEVLEDIEFENLSEDTFV